MSSYLIFQLISEFNPATMTFPASVPESARDLIRQLLAKDPTQRITHSSIFVCIYCVILLLLFLYDRLTHSSQELILLLSFRQKHH